MPEYPLSEKSPETLRTPTGLPYNSITLEAVMDGRVTMRDLRVTAEALELQAQVADAASRSQLAENLRRASELVNVPEEEILAVYDALRPGRATREQLEQLAQHMERTYRATRCADFIREAIVGLR